MRDGFGGPEVKEVTSSEALDFIRERMDRFDDRLEALETRLALTETALARIEGRLLGYLAAATIIGGILLFLAQLFVGHVLR